MSEKKRGRPPKENKVEQEFTDDLPRDGAQALEVVPNIPDDAAAPVARVAEAVEVVGARNLTREFIAAQVGEARALEMIP